MWSLGHRVLHELIGSGSTVRRFSLTAAQSTVIVERWWQVPLSKEGSPPRLYPRRHRIYKFVEDTRDQPKQDMELILTQTVPKLGGRGDTVFVKKSVGRNKLLSQGLAVYPSPENKKMFAEELRLLREGKTEDRIQTRTGEMTVNFLKSIKLQIHKMPPPDFQLTKAVVCRQLQRKFLLVVPPHALNLPFEPITEEGEYWCEVTVNGINTVRIPMSLLPYEDQSGRYKWEKKRKLRQQQQLELEQQQQELEKQEEAGLLEQQEAGQQEPEQQQQQEAELSPEVKGEAAAAVAAAAAVEADAPKNPVVSEDSSQVSVVEDTNSQTDQETTAPPSDSSKKS